MLGTRFYEHPYCTSDIYIVVSLSSDKCTKVDNWLWIRKHEQITLLCPLNYECLFVDILLPPIRCWASPRSSRPWFCPWGGCSASASSWPEGVPRCRTRCWSSSAAVSWLTPPTSGLGMWAGRPWFLKRTRVLSLAWPSWRLAADEYFRPFVAFKRIWIPSAHTLRYLHNPAEIKWACSTSVV